MISGGSELVLCIGLVYKCTRVGLYGFFLPLSSTYLRYTLFSIVQICMWIRDTHSHFVKPPGWGDIQPELAFACTVQVFSCGPSSRCHSPIRYEILFVRMAWRLSNSTDPGARRGLRDTQRLRSITFHPLGSMWTASTCLLCSLCRLRS